MSSQTTPRLFPIVLVIALMTAIVLKAVLNTEPAKNLRVDILVQVTLYTSLVLIGIDLLNHKVV